MWPNAKEMNMIGYSKPEIIKIALIYAGHLFLCDFLRASVFSHKFSVRYFRILCVAQCNL